VKRIAKKVNINWDIRAPEVRVIDSEGKQVGILPLKEAMKIAEEQG
jgi:translation initiation factor IF-3